MLTLVKLTNAEYLITSVASGPEDYYMGSYDAIFSAPLSRVRDKGTEKVTS